MSVPAALSPDHFALLQRVIRSVARTHRLSPEDAEDFTQTVHVILLERNYDVFDRYQGRSSLATFLTVVVTRMLLDWRNATRGKWRPSARALRLGAEASMLERLIHRDGLTREEAIGTVLSKGSAASRDALAALAAQLPRRPRRTFLRELTDEARGCLPFDDPISAAEMRQRRRTLRRALRRACASLGADERRLLELRYGRAYSVRAIGDVLHTDPKPLYRKIERTLKTLRDRLVSMGIDDTHLESLA
ncbi:MAG: sigma-70 family RNA polymerase sigma factor [Vicinamibacterales bacterium]